MPFSDARVMSGSGSRALESSVGRPRPRLTYSPGCRSRATRRTIRSGGMPVGPTVRSRTSRSYSRPHRRLSSRMAAASSGRSHATTRSTNAPGVTTASGSSPAGVGDRGALGDREAGGGAHLRIEVARAAAVDEVAVAVATRGAHQREVGAQRRLEQVAPTAELALLLATGDVGADSRRG